MSYKTFEDMKDQIPDGAVYYQDENEFFSFAWFNEAKDKCHFNGGWYECSMDQYPEEQIIKIPDQLDAHLGIDGGEEWKNGDECVFTDRNGEDKTCKVIGLFPPFIESYVLHCESTEPTFFISNIGRMKKPETPQQREERERLESVREMWVDCGYMPSRFDIPGLEIEKTKKDLFALYDAGYRKESK